MEWHPFAEKFPILEGQEFGELCESIKQTDGIDEDPIIFRMYCGKKQFLDGRNRLLACQRLGIRPSMRKVNIAEDDVKKFIIRRNVTRRHLTTDFRQALVLELKLDGQSNGVIAETLGKCERTIRNDVEKLFGPGSDNSEPQPDRVTGKDGKSYPAAKPKMLCSRCQRVGAIDGCEACKEERANARKKDPREPGSTEPVQHRKPKPGKPLFDDRSITDLIRKFVKAIDARAAVYGKTPAFKDIENRLEAVAASWKRWQLEKEVR